MTIRQLIEEFPNRLGINNISRSDDQLPRRRDRMVKEAPKMPTKKKRSRWPNTPAK